MELEPGMHKFVQDYYGDKLQTSTDPKTAAGCDIKRFPLRPKPLFARIRPTVLAPNLRVDGKNSAPRVMRGGKQSAYLLAPQRQARCARHVENHQKFLLTLKWGPRFILTL